MTDQLETLFDELHVPAATLSVDRRVALQQRVTTFVADRPAVRLRRSRRRTLVMAVLSGALVAGGGVAVASQVWGSAPVTSTDTARCYSAATKDLDTYYVTVGAVDETDDGQVVAPIEVCALVWKNGGMQYPHPLQTPPPADGYPFFVPELVGCVLPDGMAAVFPGTSGTCQTLGLPDALPR